MKQFLVTLIRTPPVLPVSSVTAQQGVPSLGLAYLGAALKASNLDVHYIDALGEKLLSYHDFGFEGLLACGLHTHEILDRIPLTSGLIAVSCQFSNDWIYAKKILKAINDRFPDIPIVCGGEHTTADYAQMIQDCPFLLGCAIGEGEETLVDLAQRLHQGLSVEGTPGLALAKPDGTFIPHTSRKRTKEIDQISLPDWEHLPLTKYLDAGLGMAAQGLRSMPVLASRGCTYQCTFCSAPGMWASKWYGRNVDQIIAEIRTYIERYKVEHIEFYDMSPSLNKIWLTTLTEKMKCLNISWNFPSGMRTENLGPELLKSMKDSGCYKMTFALETSEPRLIKKLKKNVNPQKLSDLIKYAATIGLITKVNFIWGLPTQTRRNILTDYWYIFKLGIAGLHDVTCFAFVPYPGSQEFFQLKAQNKLPKGEEYDKFLAFNVYNNPLRMRSWSDHLTDVELSVYTLSGMAVFYSTQFICRPWRLVQLVKKVLNGSPETMLELALFSLKRAFVDGFKTKLRIAAPAYVNKPHVS